MLPAACCPDQGAGRAGKLQIGVRFVVHQRRGAGDRLTADRGCVRVLGLAGGWHELIELAWHASIVALFQAAAVRRSRARR
jgi:hypothetical protein